MLSLKTIALKSLIREAMLEDPEVKKMLEGLLNSNGDVRFGTVDDERDGSPLILNFYIVDNNTTIELAFSPPKTTDWKKLVEAVRNNTNFWLVWDNIVDNYDSIIVKKGSIVFETNSYGVTVESSRCLKAFEEALVILNKYFPEEN